jgi:hypothetical protein
MVLDQKPMKWMTPFTYAYTLEFCSMTVDSLLQLHVYLQERTREGAVKKFHVVWKEWLSYKTTLEEFYIPAVSIKEAIFPCFTYKVSPSSWASSELLLLDVKQTPEHFFLGTESIGLEVLASSEPAIIEIMIDSDEWDQIGAQTKSKILIRTLDDDQIDQILGQNDKNEPHGDH